MFYKLIHNDLDKRKKIDGELATYDGLVKYATGAFGLEGKNIGFLFLGADDVSAYEVACDDDLEYVIEATKSYSGSKFVTIKLIENLETAPEKPERFSTVDGELVKEESFDMIGGSSVKKEERTEMKNDLEKFDEKLVDMTKKQNDEDIKMINDIENMVANVRIEEEKEMKKLNEELEKIDLPEVDENGSNIYKVDFEKKMPEVVEPVIAKVEEPKPAKADKKQKKVEKKIKKIEKIKNKILKKKEMIEKRVEKKMKKFEKKLEKLEKKKEKMLPSDPLKNLAEKISESILLTGEENGEDVQSRLSEILNETLGQINVKLEAQQKDMKAKKQAKKMEKFLNIKDKFSKKAQSMNEKLAKIYSKLSPENQAMVPLEQLVFTSEMGLAPSRELEGLRFEVDRLMAENIDLQERFETVSNRALELEGKLQSLNHLREVPVGSENGRKVTVETTHMNITCDKCHTSNFKGRRFKCLVCPDFDLCEKCEHSHIHGHPMIRMTSNTPYSRKIDWVMNFVRKNPMFHQIFNLNTQGGGNMQVCGGRRGRNCRRGRGGFPWWKMFSGPKKWGKCGWKKNQEASSEESSSSSGSDNSQSKSPKRRHRGRHRGGNPWKFMAKMFQNGGPFPFGGPMCGKRNWWKGLSPEEQKKHEEERKRRFEERRKRRQERRAAKKNQKKEKIEKLVPEEIKESLKNAGVEILDAYVTTDTQKKPCGGVEVGTNTIEVEIPITKESVMQTEKVQTEDKAQQKEEDMMKEDKIIRKPSMSFIVEDEKVEEIAEDFKIEEEKPAETNEEREIRERKEFMRAMLGEHEINSEILHFFVVSNLDLDKDTFAQFVQTQKKFLLK